MIVIAGNPDEEPVRMVCDALDAIGAATFLVDEARMNEVRLDVRMGGAGEGGAITGLLATGTATMALEDLSAAYHRLLGANLSPALRRVLDMLDILPGRILNRPAAMASNASKPFQAHAARACGFAVPETLITNDPDRAGAFIRSAWDAGTDVVYKSASSVRSVVKTIGKGDLVRLDAIRWCPVQFQHRVEGTDIRVHVVGTKTFAARIGTDAVDYRYAARQTDAEPVLEATEIDASLSGRCIALAERLGLPLAGIDLRETPDGGIVCFEANPAPAFSYYEIATGLPIADAIARYLAGEDG